MITPAKLRAAALSLPRAVEKPHFDWASFRVDAPKGKIFCTLPPHHEFSNVFLTTDEQRLLCEAEPAIFFPVPNKWGLKGATYVELQKVPKDMLRDGLTVAYCTVAPKRLAEKYS